MSFLQTLGKLLPPWRAKNYSISDLDDDLFKNFEVKTFAGVEVNNDSALKLATAYACIRVRAETISSLPFHIKRRDRDGNRYPAPDHPVQKLLSVQANERMSAWQWKLLMQTHAELRGNAFSLKEYYATDKKKLKRLIPLNPDRMRVDIPKDSPYLRYFFKQDDGREVEIPYNKIFHLTGGLSLDGVMGLNPVQYHRETIGLGLAAEKHGATYFGNGIFPGGSIKYEGTISDIEEKDRKQKELNQKFGKDEAHRWIVLDKPWTIEPLKISNVDAQYLELRQFQVEQVCSIYNVPQVLVQHSDKASTYASTKEFVLNFSKFTVLPMTVNWESAITFYLLNEDEQQEYYPNFSLSGIERADIKTRFEAYKMGREMGIYSADDILEMEDQNPIGGDEGKIHLYPLNMGDLRDLNLSPAERKEKPSEEPMEDENVDADTSDEQPS